MLQHPNSPTLQYSNRAPTGHSLHDSPMKCPWRSSHPVQISLVRCLGNAHLPPLMTEESQARTERSRNPMDYRYSDVEDLSRFVTDTGKILPRRITGLTALQQRHITRQIKNSRTLLLMK